MLAVLLAGICGISAFPQSEFRYTTNYLQTDTCHICYYLGCYPMDKARCTYYSLASDITGNNRHKYESQNEIIDEVDDMIFEYSEKASKVPVYKDCIPLISQYTNCNRDNICTGCKTCNCDSEGRWNCSFIQRCRTDHVIPLNHHTLVIVMEKLNENKNTITNTRAKRSVEGKKILSPEEVLKWMYGVEGFNNDYIKTTTNLDINSLNRSNAVDKDLHEKRGFNESESQPLVFEDLLKNLNLNDDKNHFSLEDNTQKNIIYEFDPNSLNEITSSLISDTTILDDDRRNKSDTDSIIDNVFPDIDLDFNENYNYKRDINYNNRRLKKRDIGAEPNVTLKFDNNTQIELQNILLPFNNIVLQRQEEVDKLIDIREKLITYIKSVSGINMNNSLTNITNENNTHLYLIQLGSYQSVDDSLENDKDINKYLQKLKGDIYEVVRDIAGIQRLSNDTTIPYDIKKLVQAMKKYVNKNNKKQKKSYENKNTIDLRKTSDTDVTYKSVFKPTDELIKILEVLDNDLPTFDILNSLTADTRKILARIIKTFYKYNITNGSLIKTYNLSRNLEDIGKNWDEMTIDIATNSLSERLYSMRLFYLAVSLDIEKMEDALVVFKFAENRRMSIINDFTGERHIHRISNDLRKIHRKLEHIVQIQATNTGPKDTYPGNKLYKKKTFLQHIKTLLKKSKMDIRKLFHRKNPKSQIVKQIAKKKIDEIRKNKLAEYKQTMQRWQKNLNVFSRNKRAAGSFQNFINSIRNLFPGSRKTYKKKGNKTQQVKKRSTKRGNDEFIV